MNWAAVTKWLRNKSKWDSRGLKTVCECSNFPTEHHLMELNLCRYLHFIVQIYFDCWSNQKGHSVTEIHEVHPLKTMKMSWPGLGFASAPQLRGGPGGPVYFEIVKSRPNGSILRWPWAISSASTMNSKIASKTPRASACHFKLSQYLVNIVHFKPKCLDPSPLPPPEPH